MVYLFRMHFRILIRQGLFMNLGIYTRLKATFSCFYVKAFITLLGEISVGVHILGDSTLATCNFIKAEFCTFNSNLSRCRPILPLQALVTSLSIFLSLFLIWFWWYYRETIKTHPNGYLCLWVGYIASLQK